MLRGPRPDWEHHLVPVLFNLRCRENAATKMCPSRTLLGYELPRPGDQNINRYAKGCTARAGSSSPTRGHTPSPDRIPAKVCRRI